MSTPLCGDCGGTILAFAIAGTPRGTCRCPRASVVKVEVIALRERLSPGTTVPVYRVAYNGKICSPSWLDKGPAEAYRDALQRGERQPEFSRPEDWPAAQEAR